MIPRPLFWIGVVALVLVCDVSEAKRKGKKKIAAVLEDTGSSSLEGNVAISNYTYHGNDDYRVNVEFRIAEPGYSNLSLSNIFERCESATGEHCEVELAFPIDDFCGFLLKKPDKVWQVLLNNFKPPLSCPMKGVYEMKDVKIEELVDHMMTMGGGPVGADRYHYKWSQCFTIKPSKEDLVCVWFLAYLKQVRV